MGFNGSIVKTGITYSFSLAVTQTIVWAEVRLGYLSCTQILDWYRSLEVFRGRADCSLEQYCIVLRAVGEPQLLKSCRFGIEVIFCRGFAFADLKKMQIEYAKEVLWQSFTRLHWRTFLYSFTVDAVFMHIQDVLIFLHVWKKCVPVDRSYRVWVSGYF